LEKYWNAIHVEPEEGKELVKLAAEIIGGEEDGE
jgi:hypothetical protein